MTQFLGKHYGDNDSLFLIINNEHVTRDGVTNRLIGLLSRYKRQVQGHNQSQSGP